MIEEQDIHVADMVIGNAPIPSISDVLLCQQILLRQLILCAISGGPLFFTSVVRERVAVEAIDDSAQGGIELLRRDMPPIDVGNLIGSKGASQMPGHLMRA